LYKNLHRLQESTVHLDNYVEDYFEEWGDRTSSLCVNFRRTKWKRPVYEKCRFIHDIAPYFPNVSIIILEYLTYLVKLSQVEHLRLAGVSKRVVQNTVGKFPEISTVCLQGFDDDAKMGEVTNAIDCVEPFVGLCGPPHLRSIRFDFQCFFCTLKMDAWRAKLFEHPKVIEWSKAIEFTCTNCRLDLSY